MDSEAEILLERANNEFTLALSIKKISEDAEMATKLEIPGGMTFYSSVISHAYYSIFYAAKAYLRSKKIKFRSKQGIHQQVYIQFRQFVIKKTLDKELLIIYDNIKDKADMLLGIIGEEKRKRKVFTYETIPQANIAPADESLLNARTFISHIKSILEKS